MSPPVVSVAGFSGAGKTTLIARLIPALKAMGLVVGTVKHHEHSFDMDTPGKDSWVHRRAGAAGTIISSPAAIGLIRDVDYDHDPRELALMLPGVALVLAEGYKNAPIPKMEVFRAAVSERPFCPGDRRLIAMITDDPVDWSGPVFSPGDTRGLAEFLVRRFGLQGKTRAGS